MTVDRVAISLCRVLFDTPRANDALLFMTILSTDLRALRRRGYNGILVDLGYNLQLIHLQSIVFLSSSAQNAMSSPTTIVAGATGPRPAGTPARSVGFDTLSRVVRRGLATRSSPRGVSRRRDHHPVGNDEAPRRHRVGGPVAPRGHGRHRLRVRGRYEVWLTPLVSTFRGYHHGKCTRAAQPLIV